MAKSVANRSHQATDAYVRNNLPSYLTSFVGRDSDLRALKSLVNTSRLITLVGPGGSGKTRLAAELVRRCLKNWPDGVWWVELDALTDSGQVPGAVVAAMELPGRGAAQDVVSAWLASKRALLVLDNCEHLVVACATFCKALLERCSEVTVIATSQEPLGVLGEALWPLSPMRSSDALMLFETRAQLIVPGFKVAAPNLESVSEICERLDGLPLAIEMAAARMGLMTEQELLANLSHRLRLLTTGARTAPERQQAMVAAIDWSHRLLTEGEARLFRRLSVFRGGFTMESAQAVCSDGDETNFEYLTGLVQKSMVMAERIEGAGTRYRLLEAQRAYAEEKLRDAGEVEMVHKRHYEYFLAGILARTEAWGYLSETPHGVAEEEWKAREWANLQAALTWANVGAEDKGLQLAPRMALGPGLSSRVLVSAGSGERTQAWVGLAKLLEQSPLQGVVRVDALGTVAWLAIMQGDYEAALSPAQAALAMARELDDVETRFCALILVVQVHHGLSNAHAEAEFVREATSLLSSPINKRLRNSWRHESGIRAGDRGESKAAVEILSECVAFSRSINDVSAIAAELDSLAGVQLDIGDLEGATRSWTESFTLSRELKDLWNTLYCLNGLASVASASHNDQRALRLAGAANRVSVEWSLTWDPGVARSHRFQVALEQSRTRLGTRRSQQAWTEGAAMSLDRAIEYALSTEEPESVGKVGPLSRRESEVAALVAAGMTNRHIAERLFISERTAEGHIERIRNKLGLSSRAHLAAWAVEHGLASRFDADTPDLANAKETPVGSLSPVRRKDD
jgi:non-specific serine/threonine protein kinase